MKLFGKKSTKISKKPKLRHSDNRHLTSYGDRSLVADGQEQGHLGQGLLIVSLIADYHGARVDARNRAQGGIDGVCFRVIIPTIHS